MKKNVHRNTAAKQLSNFSQVIAGVRVLSENLHVSSSDSYAHTKWRAPPRVTEIRLADSHRSSVIRCVYLRAMFMHLTRRVTRIDKYLDSIKTVDTILYKILWYLYSLMQHITTAEKFTSLFVFETNNTTCLLG